MSDPRNPRPLMKEAAMKAKREPERLLPLEEVGTRLGKTAQAIRMMIYRGDIEAVRIGKRGLRIKASVLEQFIRRLQPV